MEPGETGIVMENIAGDSNYRHEKQDRYIHEIEEKHRSRLLHLLMFSTAPFVCLVTVKNTIDGDHFTAAIGVFMLASFYISYVFLKTQRSSLEISRILLSIIGIIFLRFITDPDPEAYRLLWAYLYPLITFFLLGKREGLVWSSIFLIVAGVSVYFYPFPAAVHFSGEFKLRFLITFGLVGVMSFLFEFTRHETHRLMVGRSRELERSEKRYRSTLLNLEKTQNGLIQSGKLASIGELASGVAHELNQPVMIIRTTVQLMMRKQRKNVLHAVKLREDLTAIEKNTKRMMNIINHLRTFSRQDKGPFVPLNANRIIQNTFLMIGAQLHLNNIEVIQDLSNDLPEIMGNPNQLEQVFLNLLTNARDAVESRPPAKGGRAELHKRIVISTHVQDDRKEMVEIRIKDTGGGIPAKVLRNIFDPFFTTKEVGMGTGLGLSISYGIIKDHGGEIDVGDTGPEGTTFRIRLPGASSFPENAKHRKEIPKGKNERKNIGHR